MSVTNLGKRPIEGPLLAFEVCKRARLDPEDFYDAVARGDSTLVSSHLFSQPTLLENKSCVARVVAIAIKHFAPSVFHQLVGSTPYIKIFFLEAVQQRNQEAFGFMLRECTLPLNDENFTRRVAFAFFYRDSSASPLPINTSILSKLLSSTSHKEIFFLEAVRQRDSEAVKFMLEKFPSLFHSLFYGDENYISRVAFAFFYRDSSASPLPISTSILSRLLSSASHKEIFFLEAVRQRDRGAVEFMLEEYPSLLEGNENYIRRVANTALTKDPHGINIFTYLFLVEKTSRKEIFLLEAALFNFESIVGAILKKYTFSELLEKVPRKDFFFRRASKLECHLVVESMLRRCPELVEEEMKKEDLDFLRFLSKCYWCLKVRDSSTGDTFLHRAVKMRLYDIVFYLIKKMDQCDLLNNDGLPPIWYALKNRDDKLFNLMYPGYHSRRKTLWIIAAEQEDNPDLLLFLLGLDENSGDKNGSAACFLTHWALRWNNEKLLRKLLRWGILSSEVNKFGKTPLYLALCNKSHTVEPVKILIEGGASLDDKFNGKTYSSIAFEQGWNYESIELLALSSKTWEQPRNALQQLNGRKIGRPSSLKDMPVICKRARLDPEDFYKAVASGDSNLVSSVLLLHPTLLEDKDCVARVAAIATKHFDSTVYSQLLDSTSHKKTFFLEAVQERNQEAFSLILSGYSMPLNDESFTDRVAKAFLYRDPLASPLPIDTYILSRLLFSTSHKKIFLFEAVRQRDSEAVKYMLEWFSPALLRK